MNPYDFFYLDDFLKFSPFSPNHGNLNMVSEPGFRSPGTRSAFAIVPVPENSSIAYHKEIYTVLFDPPSFLMVYSIVCHLWKKSKIEKRFLPLPPLLKPPQQVPINFAIASTMDEDDDLDSDFAIASTMDEDENLDCEILEKSNSEFAFACFSFGNFQSDIIPIKSIEHVKPEIRGFVVKIGQIEYFLNIFKEEHNSGSASSLLDQALGIKEELVKTRNVSSASAISLLRCETTQNQALDLVCFEKSECDGSVIIDPQFESLFWLFSSAAAIVAVKTVFDPGGVIELLSIVTVLDDYGEILHRESQFHNNGETDRVITIFDPGGRASSISSFAAYKICCNARLWWIPWDRGRKKFDPGGTLMNIDIAVLHR